MIGRVYVMVGLGNIAIGTGWLAYGLLRGKLEEFGRLFVILLQ